MISGLSEKISNIYPIDDQRMFLQDRISNFLSKPIFLTKILIFEAV